MAHLSLTPATAALYSGSYTHTPELRPRADGTLVHDDDTGLPPLAVKAVHRAGDYVLVIMDGDDGDELILMAAEEFTSQM